jgi:GNAT superfamily N-acetyltransferase
MLFRGSWAKPKRGNTGPASIGRHLWLKKMARLSAPITFVPISRAAANCGYMTEAASSGRGVAKQMCEHSLEYARSAGFLAMQFNFVVSSNERAVRLWQFLGFDIVGRLPAAFRTPSGSYVDALVMFKTL